MALALVGGLAALGPAAATAGTLQIYANGEELITEGFLAPKLSKDGWQLTFEAAWVTVSGITAYQSEPPFDSRRDQEIRATRRVALAGAHTIDLASGSAEEPPVLVGEVSGAAPGHYNAIAWEMTRAETGPWAGYSLVLVGKAAKAGREVAFELRSRDQAQHLCGEFVGDERKGLLTAGGKADLEVTFHFDHIFGRADKAADDPMNLEAVGFSPFAAGGVQNLKLAGMHLGHAGEGHCRVLWR